MSCISTIRCTARLQHPGAFPSSGLSPARRQPWPWRQREAGLVGMHTLHRAHCFKQFVLVNHAKQIAFKKVGGGLANV